MIDVGALLPAAITRSPKQPAVTPDEALREQIGTVGRPRIFTFGKPSPGVRHDLCAWLPVAGGERLDLCGQLLWGDLLQLQHVAHLSRSSGAGYGVEAAELFSHTGMNGAADIAGL